MAEKPGIATRLGVSKCTDTLHQYTDTLHADTLHQYTDTEKPGIATRLHAVGNKFIQLFASVY
jgi:hypothetical protein